MTGVSRRPLVGKSFEYVFEQVVNENRRWLARALAVCLGALSLGLPGSVRANGVVAGSAFRFDADTFSFANETVYVYPKGYAEKRALKPGEKPPAFVLHCFVMSRASEQFRNFARFDPSLPPPDDDTLTRLVRLVTSRGAWRSPLPPDKRVVIPGYTDLRSLSTARPLIVQKNIGLGWTAYIRVGNWRMFPAFLNGPTQQRHTQERVEGCLARNDLFIAYLTTYPSLSVNHAVVIYGRRPATPADTAAGMIHYLVYDPNHPDGPRDMAYDTHKCEFSYQKDWDFVGGKLTVLQVFSYWGQ